MHVARVRACHVACSASSPCTAGRPSVRRAASSTPRAASATSARCAGLPGAAHSPAQLKQLRPPPPRGGSNLQASSPPLVRLACAGGIPSPHLMHAARPPPQPHPPHTPTQHAHTHTQTHTYTNNPTPSALRRAALGAPATAWCTACSPAACSWSTCRSSRRPTSHCCTSGEGSRGGLLRSTRRLSPDWPPCWRHNRACAAWCRAVPLLPVPRRCSRPRLCRCLPAGARRWACCALPAR